MATFAYRFLLLNLAAAISLGGLVGAAIFAPAMDWRFAVCAVLALGVQPLFCALYARTFPGGLTFGRLASYSFLTGGLLIVQAVLFGGGFYLSSPP